MRKIENCEVCLPIDTIISDLTSMGYVIVEQKVDDYHFHQVYYKLRGNYPVTKTYPEITIKNHKYICKCHWSTIEIVQN
jgi:hypothetical protein